MEETAEGNGLRIIEEEKQYKVQQKAIVVVVVVFGDGACVLDVEGMRVKKKKDTGDGHVISRCSREWAEFNTNVLFLSRFVILSFLVRTAKMNMMAGRCHTTREQTHR